MNHSTCSRKARENIKDSVKQKLLRHSNFACSICGKIPVVFHHIEEWSEKFSNNEDYLIPICDTCHRSIHGKGGPVLTKKELYRYKSHPNSSRFLKYKYPLERKHNYSFFVGSNLVANGEKATLFRFEDYPLTTVDTSSGILKLSILADIQNNKPHYLIKDNELMIDTDDVWKMEFSVPALKIWKKTMGKKVVFIDLTIKSDIIIIREMNTMFNGKLFCVYELRTPQKRQVKKIDGWVKDCEKYYYKVSAQIDKQPQIANPLKSVDVDKQIKDLQKDRLKHELEQKLIDVLSQNFKWDWNYCWHVLDRILKKSPVFRKEKKIVLDSSEKLIEILKKVEYLKKKYKKEFDELQDVIIQYDGAIFSGNIAL